MTGTATPVRTMSRARMVVVVAICCTAIFMTTLDNTVLNVALPSLDRQLKATPSELEWSVNSYILTRAALLLVAASLGDRFGRRRAFAIGLVVFVIGSIGCGLSGSAAILIVFRVVQGVGGTLMTPTSMAILAGMFPDPRRRAQVLGVWSAATGISTSAGPTIGGLLVQTFGWQSVFFINVPIGLFALAGVRLLRASPVSSPRPIRIVPQVTIGAALVALVYGLITGPASGWDAPPVLIALGISALSTAVFIVTELRSPSPLFAVSPGMQRRLASAAFVAVACYVALNGFTYYNSLYLQEVRGLSPLLAGLAVTPVTVATIVLSPLAGYLTGRWGDRIPAVIATSLIAVPLAALAFFLTPGTPFGILIACYAALGIGYGVINPPLTNASVASMPPEASGVAAATTSTARQIGTSLGIAIVGAIVYGSIPASEESAHHGRYVGAAALAFTHGLSIGWAVTAGVAALALLAAIWGFRRDYTRADPVSAASASE